MKKRGFTLIELLAVIIILAVVALIATPITLNIIDDVRKSAIERSAEGYYNAAEYVYGQMMLDSNKEDVTFTFENGVQTSSNSKYTLELKGEKAKGGMVYLGQDGQILVSIHNGKYCATVGYDGTVSLSEDIESCSFIPIPERCFNIVSEQVDLSYGSDFLNMEELPSWLTKNYNTLYYNSDVEGCPTEINTLMIPGEVNGKKVEAIGMDAFVSNDSIKKVVIPSGVEIIGSEALGDCQNLETVILPDTLRYISAYLFISNPSLVHIDLPSSVTYIDQYAFEESGLKSVVMKEGVTGIGTNAFYNNQLTSVTIPDSVTSIGDYAFYNNQLTSVVIGNSVTSIGKSAFWKNKLTSVVIPDSVISIGEFAFFGNQLTNATIGNSVTSIDQFAFQENKLTSITIGNSVTSIGLGAFNGNQLTNVTIPTSVTSIGGGAFVHNNFPNASAITIEGDSTRFDSNWTNIGFPAKS